MDATSKGSTVPDVISYEFNPNGNEGDFARLRPLSLAAKTNFSAVAEQFENQLDWALIARRFIRYEEDFGPQRQFKYRGYYRCNMTIAPQSSDPAKADFLLALPKAGISLAVWGTHCQLFHDPTSTSFMIRILGGTNVREVIVSGH
ncbi:hypothetical protein LTR66_010075 [Elasticomyces elasticus]|nr:hypothetical protein LTR66_010075 [Elasticomyces elasticus]